MKKIVNGKVLQDSMRDAINLLCDTVKCTLGPKGSNVIIDNSTFSPFITNDGVTIAENIESDEEVVNVILELAKEASIVTNKTVGDGTTTTLVILQSLFNLSLDMINAGVNPMVLKKQLNEVLEKVIKLLVNEKKNVNDEVVYNIAKIASSDDEMARIVSDVFSKIPYKDAVSVKEVEEDMMCVNYFNGYKFQSILPSSLLLKDKLFLSYQNSLVLIVDDTICDLENMSSIFNEAFNGNKSLVVIANDFAPNFTQQIVSYVLNDELSCLLVKINDYGTRLRSIEKDLEVISGAKIVNSERDISVYDLGTLDNIFVTKDDFRVDFTSNEKINNYILNVQEELKNISDDYLKEFYYNRLSMFRSGSAQIVIGAVTKTELREKRMRLDDAMCAVYSSNEGVLVGGGVTLLKVASQLNEDDDVCRIWKKSLEVPFMQLMCNSGLDYKNIRNEIERNNYNLVYNVSNDSFEDVSKSYIVDSYKVVLNSIVNACSIASMLITTDSLVINEKVNNLNKVSEYGEI